MEWMRKSWPLVACFWLLSPALFGQGTIGRWTASRACNWYFRQPWICGSNFIPSSADNQLEMWQAATFDTAVINRELGYAEGIGFNTVRVFLHHVAWLEDPAGFKNRINTYLGIAHSHHIRTIFVFFDDCWNDSYKAGPQPPPKPGVHNSRWLRDPGSLYYQEPLLQDTLKKYVQDILTTFGHDPRILLWDLYNEPGNSGYGSRSLDLLQKVFRWARAVHPDQPLSAGLWNPELGALNRFQLSHDDVITYHNYDSLPGHKKVIDTLMRYKRPLICTEYMARPRGSTFATIMPMLKRNHVGAINWGLVSGRTNTIFAWDTPVPSGREPKIWFHDIFRRDGTPFSIKEITLIQSLTGVYSSVKKSP